MNPAEMKLCKDCAHYDGTRYCTRTFVPDYINGEHTMFTATSERIWNTPEGCGPSARHFEAKS